MEKSADAFRTISEVADDLTLPQHVLRFWETRFPQIRPLKRAGGRRYYRPADIILLKTIRQLLYDDGYTIKGVQRLLKEQGAKGLTAVTAADLALLAEDEEPVAPPEAEPEEPPQQVVPPAAQSAPDLPAEPDLPATKALDNASREMITEALDTIDECLRILDGAGCAP